VSGFIAIGEIQVEDDCLALAVIAVVFIEDGIGDDVFFCSPVAKVAFAAAVAAEGKVGMQGRIGGSFADWAFVFHRYLPGDGGIYIRRVGATKVWPGHRQREFTPTREVLRR
jgi:hypothetical protein